MATQCISVKINTVILLSLSNAKEWKASRTIFHSLILDAGEVNIEGNDIFWTLHYIRKTPRYTNVEKNDRDRPYDDIRLLYIF